MNTLTKIIQRVPDSILIAELDRRFPAYPKMQAVHDAVAEAFGINSNTLRRYRNRNRIITPARFQAIHIMRERFGFAENAIAKFYQLDRGSVKYAAKTTINRLTGEEFADRYAEILEQVVAAVDVVKAQLTK